MKRSTGEILYDFENNELNLASLNVAFWQMKSMRFFQSLVAIRVVRRLGSENYKQDKTRAVLLKTMALFVINAFGILLLIIQCFNVHRPWLSAIGKNCFFEEL